MAQAPLTLSAPTVRENAGQRWVLALQLARKHGGDYLWSMLSVYCRLASIEERGGKWKIVPTLDEWAKRSEFPTHAAWEAAAKAEWAKARDEHLRPRAAEIQKVLDKLEELLPAVPAAPKPAPGSKGFGVVEGATR